MTSWDTDNLNVAHTARELQQEWGGNGMIDLVKRLRDPRGHSPTSMDGFERNAVGFRDKMCTEAAARIEQLERELAAAKQAVQHANDHADAAIDELAAEKALADMLYEDSLGEICSDAAYVSYRKARGLLYANLA